MRRRPPAPGPSRSIPAFFLYGEPLHAPDAEAIHVETIAARSQPRDWTIQPHRHHGLRQVVVVRSGGVVASIDGVEAQVRAPALLVLPPGCVHAFRFDSGTTGIVVSWGGALPAGTPVEEAALSTLFNQGAVHALDRRELHATDALRVGELLLQEFSRAAAGRDLALRGLLAALLANLQRLVHEPESPGTDPARRNRQLVARFRALVDQHFREHRPLSGYASALGCSVLRLRRACRAVAGQPPLELVQQRLVVEAARQLRYTTAPVSEIGYALGFDDPAYFTRFFTRLMGAAPRAFRERG